MIGLHSFGPGQVANSALPLSVMTCLKIMTNLDIVLKLRMMMMMKLFMQHSIEPEEKRNVSPESHCSWLKAVAAAEEEGIRTATSSVAGPSVAPTAAMHCCRPHKITSDEVGLGGEVGNAHLRLQTASPKAAPCRVQRRA